jgi:hypothetical protein
MFWLPFIATVYCYVRIVLYVYATMRLASDGQTARTNNRDGYSLTASNDVNTRLPSSSKGTYNPWQLKFLYLEVFHFP